MAQLWRLLAYGKPYWHWIAVTVVASLLYAGGLTGRAYLMQPLLDGIVLPSAQAGSLSDAIEEYAGFRLQPNSRALGPRLGPEMKNVLRAARQGEWELFEADGSQRVRIAGHELGEDEYSLLLQPRDGISCEALPSGDAIVVLDLTLSEDLLAEGRALVAVERCLDDELIPPARRLIARKQRPQAKTVDIVRRLHAGIVAQGGQKIEADGGERFDAGAGAGYAGAGNDQRDAHCLFVEHALLVPAVRPLTVAVVAGKDDQRVVAATAGIELVE